jgi:hypothetical protein
MGVWYLILRLNLFFLFKLVILDYFLYADIKKKLKIIKYFKTKKKFKNNFYQSKNHIKPEEARRTPLFLNSSNQIKEIRPL